jgi:hypothetical protein
LFLGEGYRDWKIQPGYSGFYSQISCQPQKAQLSTRGKKRPSEKPHPHRYSFCLSVFLGVGPRQLLNLTVLPLAGWTPGAIPGKRRY